jgi:Icc-related predicted phosphoesterase
MEPVRIAAAGDVHASEPLREHLLSVFANLADEADVLLLAGDLTTHGLPDQAEVLADACRGAGVPVFAVLGNHDYHSGQAPDVCHVLAEAGVTILNRDYAICEVRGIEVGIVGTKGFVGGYAGAELPDFGERLLRDVYSETSAEVHAIECGLEAVAGCPRRVVLMHYAPITDTIVGEPEAIWAFLGSTRLAGPIGAHRPDLVVHGHAHHGVRCGTIGAVPVQNVAVHVTGEPYVVIEI